MCATITWTQTLHAARNASSAQHQAVMPTTKTSLTWLLRSGSPQLLIRLQLISMQAENAASTLAASPSATMKLSENSPSAWMAVQTTAQLAMTASGQLSLASQQRVGGLQAADDSVAAGLPVQSHEIVATAAAGCDGLHVSSLP